MVTDPDKVLDPVCQMMVDPDQNAITYEGMHFAFCSEQCKERFLANPHLYIGKPGERAPGQSGQRVVKRRRLNLELPLSDDQAKVVTEQLMSMMGIYNVEITDNELVITYDLLQAKLEQVEAELQKAGALLGQGWGERLQRAFVHFLEETEVASREVPSGQGHHHH